MKPQQVSSTFPAAGSPAPASRCARVASLPALTAVAVAIASSLILTLGGCASSAGISPTAQPIDAAQVGVDPQGAAVPAVSTDWWRALGDSVLSELIERALAGNPTLKIAQTRMERAAASVAGARSAQGVQVNGAADVTRQRFSATSIYPPPLGGGIFDLAEATLGASWEIDFFGRNRAAVEAAVGVQRAAQADALAARNLLAVNVARTYVQLARWIEQREVAQRSLNQRGEILGLIRQRVQGGLDTTVELRQGEGALPETRQQIEQIDEQIAMARNALAAYTAQAPQTLESTSAPLRTVHLLPKPANVPADLLGRRADIVAARWRVEAASQDVRSAHAQFYPNVNLTAFVGLSSIGLNRLSYAASKEWGVGPAIHLPIFDAGRLRANLSGKTADLDAAVLSYNAAVLDAVHDVADQLSSWRSIERQQTEQDSAQTLAESAYDLATQRYRAGLGTYLTVLNAEANVLTQRRQATDLRARVLDVQIALIRALGGGYGAETPPPDRAALAPRAGRPEAVGS